MTDTTKILIAAHELRGGTVPKKGEAKQRVTLAAGGEMTREKAREMGLDGKAVDDLVNRGALLIVDARRSTEEDASLLPGEEGITVAEFKAFLDRHGIAYAVDATPEQLLAIAPVAA